MKYSILVIIILVIGFWGLGFMHEQVHIAIFNSYDIESELYLFSEFPDMAVSVDSIEYDLKCNDSCKLANNINEIVNYPLQVLFGVFGLAFFIIIVILEDKI